jgi:cyanophycin synthetase
VELEGDEAHELLDVADLPIALGGLARHNVANSLAAAGGARGLGASREQVAEGLRDFRPSADLSPGRMNLFRLGRRTVIVDFAHNEAGTTAILEVADGIAGGAAGRAAPITVIIGTAGDRPDDTLRGIGRIAAQRAQRIVIKETLGYLRGRERENVVRTILDGVAEGGVNPSSVRVYDSEVAALEGELTGSGAASSSNGRADAPRVVILFCHEQREDVFALLERLGAKQVDLTGEGLAALSPRLGDKRRG